VVSDVTITPATVSATVTDSPTDALAEVVQRPVVDLVTRRFVLEAETLAPALPVASLAGQGVAVISDPWDGLDELCRRIQQAGGSVEVVPTHRGAPEQPLPDDVARRLADVDFFFCCTDSHGSRAVLSQLAYQYLVPCIDTGVSITVQQGRISHITGRVQMLAPGLSCLTCAGLLDADAVRRDLMTDYERQADPYFIGAHEPQPAVISLNGTVVSLAVTMFLAAVTDGPAEARYQLYNGITGMVRAVMNTPDPTCIVCSPNGALARGDEWPLPARQS